KDVGTACPSSTRRSSDVLIEGRGARREDEAVATVPRWVGRVVPHDVLVEQVRSRCEADRRAGVAVADLLDGIGGKDSRGVGGAAVQLWPADLPGSGGGGAPGSSFRPAALAARSGCVLGGAVRSPRAA